MPPAIVLIGPRGSGKTTVGRCLAQRLGREFIDLDDIITRDANMTIRQIFERESEAGFRRRECDAVRIAVQARNAVIATGGGVVLNAENRRLLQDAGPVIWLRAPAETLARRLAQDASSCDNRPRLTDSDPLEEIRRTLAQRNRLYRRMSRLTVDTADLDIEQACKQIDEALAQARLD